MSSGNDTMALARSVGMGGAGRRRGGTTMRIAIHRPVGMGRRRKRGGSFFGSIGNWVKGAANSVGNFVKKNHVLSTVAGFIPHPAARAAALGLRLGGLGRRRRRGGNIGDRLQSNADKFNKANNPSLLSRAHSFIKKHRVVSRGLAFLKYPKLSLAAHTMGYGKRRKRVVRRKRGGAMIGPVNRSRPMRLLHRAHAYVKGKKLISHTLNHLGYTKAGSIAASLGYGRRRKRGGTMTGTIAAPPKSRLRKLHDYVKSKKLVSSTLNHLGYTKAGAVAAALGYGHRRRVVRRRTVRRR